MADFNTAAWLVDRHVDEGWGGRVAIRCEGRSTSYTDLATEIARAQAMLSSLGLGFGDRVAMVVQDDEAFPAFFLGAQRGGMVAVPLSTMLHGQELAAIVADCGATVLIVSDTFVSALDAIADGAPELRDIVVAGPAPIASLPASIDVHRWTEYSSSELPAVARTSRDSAAFWLYSSGTTGTPKGVMHVHGNVPATIDTYATTILGIGPDDRFLSVPKLFFAYGLGNSLTFPLAVGATAILNPAPSTPPGIIDLIEDELPTLFFSSPGFCAALLDSDPDASIFHSVRATVTAGESLPANIQTRFAELTSGPVLDGIGSTELLHIFISNTLEHQSPGSSGRVVPGYEAQLRDDADTLITEPDTPGYLHVRGDSAASGYWQKPDATAEAFRDGWVRTGDVYTRSADGVWTFLGRNSDMIKAGGIWVSPAEVESALIEHPTVLEAAVVGDRDEKGLETVVAFVVPSSGAVPDPAELETHCRARMASFKRPRRIIVVDEFSKTATGKIKRFELRQSFRR
jgi:benzoate-CoA ligase